MHRLLTAEDLARMTPAGKAERLLELKENWDTYGAKKISPEAVKAARTFLEQMRVVPCCDGGVQVEVHACHADLEIEFKADGSIKAISCAWDRP